VTWYKDLGNCDYFGAEISHFLLAVGWLDKNYSFPKGRVSEDVYTRLVELFESPYQFIYYAGVHLCEFCLYEPEATSAHNLFIPNGEIIYACPEMIKHYMNAHSYKPPTSFCDAVLKCPDTRSKEYRKLFMKSGGREIISSLKRKLK